MVEMEPRFKLDKFKFIFADQGVSDTLLELLHIEETYLLRCNYYHLIYEVWPLPENFGW